MSKKARDMLNLFRECGLKHKKGCFAKTCEECIDRFDNSISYIFDEQKCRVCGCTWDNACSGGCYWVEEDLCSRCVDAEQMTNEQAIEILNKYDYSTKLELSEGHRNKITKGVTVEEFFQMKKLAIKALEKQEELAIIINRAEQENPYDTLLILDVLDLLKECVVEDDK